MMPALCRSDLQDVKKDKTSVAIQLCTEDKSNTLLNEDGEHISHNQL
jgi:hypothetical protein